MSLSAFGGTDINATVAALIGTPPIPEPTPALTVEPAARAPVKRRPAIIKPETLAEDVDGLEARLGKSLGVASGPQGYEPGAFVKAIDRVHDRLAQVRADLTTWRDELDARENALSLREAATARREAEVQALTDLLNSPAAGGAPRATHGLVARGVRSWLGL